MYNIVNQEKNLLSTGEEFVRNAVTWSNLREGEAVLFNLSEHIPIAIS